MLIRLSQLPRLEPLRYSSTINRPLTRNDIARTRFPGAVCSSTTASSQRPPYHTSSSTRRQAARPTFGSEPRQHQPYNTFSSTRGQAARPTFGSESRQRHPHDTFSSTRGQAAQPSFVYEPRRSNASINRRRSSFIPPPPRLLGLVNQSTASSHLRPAVTPDHIRFAPRASREWPAGGAARSGESFNLRDHLNATPSARRRSFEEFAENENVTTQENQIRENPVTPQILNIPGAFPVDTPSHQAAVTMHDQNHQHNNLPNNGIIFRFGAQCSAKFIFVFNVALEQTHKMRQSVQRDGLLYNAYHSTAHKTKKLARPANAVVIHTYRAAAQGLTGCKRRLVNFTTVGRRGNAHGNARRGNTRHGNTRRGNTRVVPPVRPITDASATTLQDAEMNDSSEADSSDASSISTSTSTTISGGSDIADDLESTDSVDFTDDSDSTRSTVSSSDSDSIEYTDSEDDALPSADEVRSTIDRDHATPFVDEQSSVQPPVRTEFPDSWYDSNTTQDSPSQHDATLYVDQDQAETSINHALPQALAPGAAIISSEELINHDVEAEVGEPFESEAARLAVAIFQIGFNENLPAPSPWWHRVLDLFRGGRAPARPFDVIVADSNLEHERQVTVASSRPSTPEPEPEPAPSQNLVAAAASSPITPFGHLSESVIPKTPRKPKAFPDTTAQSLNDIAPVKQTTSPNEPFESKPAQPAVASQTSPPFGHSSPKTPSMPIASPDSATQSLDTVAPDEQTLGPDEPLESEAAQPTVASQITPMFVSSLESVIPVNPPRRIASPNTMIQGMDLITPIGRSLSLLSVSGSRGTVRQERVEAEEQARKLRAELDAQIHREMAEAAKRAERERAAQLQADEAAQWLRLMGRQQVPADAKLVEPLSSDWDHKVDMAMRKSLASELATTSSGTKLSRRDFGTVLPQAGAGDNASAWLNDEVVNAYMQLAVEHGQARTGHRRGQAPKYHAFSSFFYKNLADRGPESVKRWAGRAKLGGTELLKADTIFIPVNRSLHWTLLVVSPTRRTIEYFDSLSGAHAASSALPARTQAATHPSTNIHTDLALAWLRNELGADFVEWEWTIRVRYDGPQQENYSDCGVFCATTAKMIVLGWDPKGAYDAKNIPLQRRRMVAEIMAGGWAGDLAPKEGDLVERVEDRRGSGDSGGGRSAGAG